MLYTIVSQNDNPVTLEDAKGYLKIDHKADDVSLQLMLNAVFNYAETYTSRDFRETTWKLFLDDFDDRICLQKSPVDSITSVEYTLSGTLTPIASSVFYLKKGHQWSELLLNDGQSWPTDGDDVATTNEHTIEVVFATGKLARLSEAKLAVLHHLAHFNLNRGDCTVEDAAKQSGADAMYDHFRIPRL